MPDERQSGRTSAQMKKAPRGAYYVWPNKALNYPRALAKHLKRTDLKIVSPLFFGYKGRGAGLKVKIIIDHNCLLSVSQAADIARCNLLENP